MISTKAKVIGMGKEFSFKGSDGEITGRNLNVTFAQQENENGLDCGSAFCVATKIANYKIGAEIDILIDYEKGKQRKIKLIQKM